MRGMTNANSGGKVEVGGITFQDMSKNPYNYHLCDGTYYAKEDYPEYWKVDNSELCFQFYTLNAGSIGQNGVVNPPLYSNTPAFTQDGKGQVWCINQSGQLLSCFSPYNSSPWVVRYTSLNTSTGIIYTADSNTLWCAEYVSGYYNLVMINADTYTKTATLLSGYRSIGIMDVTGAILATYSIGGGNTEFNKYSYGGVRSYTQTISASDSIGKILYSHAGMTKNTGEPDLIIICNAWSLHPSQWLTGTSGSNTFVVTQPMSNITIGNLVYDRYTNNGIMGSFISTSDANSKFFSTTDGGKTWYYRVSGQGYPSNGVFTDIPGECIMYSFPLAGTEITAVSPRPVYNALTVRMNQNYDPTIITPNYCFSYQLLGVVKRAIGSYLAVGKTYVIDHEENVTTAISSIYKQFPKYSTTAYVRIR